MARDPVCGMEVDPASAAGQSEHAGITYYFCSEGCRKAFQNDPGRYVTSSSDKPAQGAPPGTGHHHGS